MQASVEFRKFQQRQYITRPGVQQTPPVLRALLMQRLAHLPGEVMWDIGAGSGSIAIEWKLHRPQSQVFAVESVEARCFDIYRNARQFGAELYIVNRFAERDVLDILPRPDLIYHGCPGECGDEDLYPVLWDYLAPGGWIISNAVSSRGVERAYRAQRDHGGEITVLDAFGLVRHQWLAQKNGGDSPQSLRHGT